MNSKIVCRTNMLKSQLHVKRGKCKYPTDQMTGFMKLDVIKCLQSSCVAVMGRKVISKVKAY